MKDPKNSSETAMGSLLAPQPISLLRPSFERSDLGEIEAIISQTLASKELETAELQTRCDGLSRKCSELEEKLGQKQREVDDLYVELMAEKTESDALRARVLQLEKEKGLDAAIEISDSEDYSLNRVRGEKVIDLEKDVVFSHTPAIKRKRASRIVTSDSEDDDDRKNEKGDEDYDGDDVPIGKLRERRVGNTNGSPDNKTPPQRRLVSLWERGASSRDSVFENVKSQDKSNNVNTRARSTARQKLVFVDNEDDEEEATDVVDSESEGESLNGFIVSGSESDQRGNDSSSDEENKEGSDNHSCQEVSASDVDLDDVLATLRRKKSITKWQYEADMLASFAEDPELCMKAVCTLYRKQTSEERSVKMTMVANNQGFNQFDALKASMIAEFLLDGDPNGPLKKSVKEFEKRYPDGLEYCRKIADRYSKQLFTIYQQGEDRFFLPS